MKCEPETVPDRDTQVEELKRVLLGNNAFGALRGKLGHELMFGIVEDSKSRSQALRDWDGLSVPMRVMLGLLAKYKNMGWKHAYDVLRQALSNPKFILPGETIPLESTKPVTIVMPEWRRLMTYIEWMINVYPEELDRYMEIKSGKLGSYTFHPFGLTQQLFDMFPSLDRMILANQAKRFGDVKFAVSEDIMCNEDFRPGLTSGILLELTRDQTWCNNKNDTSVATIYFGQSPAKVFPFFPRRAQRQMASWSFQIPAGLSDDYHYFAVGFHHESEHEKWRKEAPVFVSRNTSRGWGAIFFHNDTIEPSSIGYKLPVYGNKDNDHQKPRVPRFLLTPEGSFLSGEVLCTALASR